MILKSGFGCVMKWIGITGNIGSGKSEVLRIIKTLGLPVVDADMLARQAVSPGSATLEKIVAQFGAEILTNNHCLDRAKLGQIVFADRSQLLLLESIIHPAIRQLAESERVRLVAEGYKLAFYEVPLLFEKKLETDFDGIVLIAAQEAARRSRIAERDSLTSAQIEQRFAAQLPQEQKIPRATYVIWNDGSLDLLKKEVSKMVNFFRNAQ